MFSSSSSELRYDLRSARNNLTEVDENQSGFRDASRKPNYVVNTISKGSSHSLSAIQSGKGNFIKTMISSNKLNLNL